MGKIQEFLQKWLGQNWKTNLAAIGSFLAGVPSFVTAVTNYIHGQPADWRAAISAVIVAIGFAMAKDSSTHSTADQVQQATDKSKQ